MTKRIIDLTYTLAEGMTTFPVHWHPVVEITQLGRHGIENRETRKLVLGTHTGTHCDAPRHFVPGGKTIDQLPLDIFVGEAHVMDFSSATDGQEMQIPDFERLLNGPFPERIVMRFDWSRHWGTMKYYRDHPFISKDAARWMVERGLRLLAMDSPMPDNPRHGASSSEDSPIHKILLGSGVILVEYLTNLAALTRPVVELVVLPLKIHDGDGAGPLYCHRARLTEARFPMDEHALWVLSWFETQGISTGSPAERLQVDYLQSGVLDSFRTMELIAEIEDRFDIRFSSQQFQDRRFSTLGGLAQIIGEVRDSNRANAA